MTEYDLVLGYYAKQGLCPCSKTQAPNKKLWTWYTPLSPGGKQTVTPARCPETSPSQVGRQPTAGLLQIHKR